MIETVVIQLLNGVILGFLLVLVSIGLSLIFGILGIVNIAHGAFFALGGYFTVTLVRAFGWEAAVFAPLIVGAIGMVTERVLIRRMYGKDPLMTLILTFALAMLVEAVIRYVWGNSAQAIAPPVSLRGFLEFGPLLTTTYRIAALLITLGLLCGLWALLQFTPFGRILRAGSRDAEMVGMLGINLPLVLMGAFGVGCALAGAAGGLAGPLWTVTPSMGAQALMPAFIIVSIGGLGSYKGAIVAGLMVGIATALTTQFYPAASGAAMYVLMAVILLIRPRGLFGERWEHMG